MTLVKPPEKPKHENQEGTFYIKRVSLNGVPVEKLRDPISGYMSQKYDHHDESFYVNIKEKINMSGE